MVYSCNPLAQAYRKVRDAIVSSNHSHLSLRLYRKRSNDSRMHNIPTADEVAGLIVGDFEDSDIGRDVIINERNFGLTRIHETHVLFLPLQYPLLFPRGENGWEPDIPRIVTEDASKEKKERKKAQRLSFIRQNQSKIRQDILSGLQEAVDRGDVDASLVGKRIIVPDSFTGGPRYMFNNCQDAMGICKSVVASFMIHGPYGASNRDSPCMNGTHSCSKFFPKKYKSSTTIDEDGYQSYKRRDTGVVVQKNGVKLDNGNVVPYNPFLLMRYQGHINVESCNKSNAIKYLFKYVNKGPDRSNVQISNSKSATDEPEILDEIKRFYDYRYISPCEATWRLLAFDIHQKFPAVIRLSIHLENQQSVTFNDGSSLHNVVSYREMADTMFLAWFNANLEFEEGRDLTYAEFPSKFVYSSQYHRWQPRQKGSSIGRLTYVPVGAGELYYLRVLLTKQRGSTSYESIKTVNGKICKTLQEACSELLLLKDDQEFKDGFKEAYETATGGQMRSMFVRLLNMNTMSNPLDVWRCTWKLFADGILYNRRRQLNLPELQIYDDELQNLCLIEINKLLMTNGRSLSDYKCMHVPVVDDVHTFENKLIADELSYNRVELGIGKTFLWKTLSAALRSQGKIVLNVASSGIASLLLPNAFDTTMKDLMSKVDINNKYKPFGGKVVVLGIPNHRLTLKVGVPVMLLRNIDQAMGLCNDPLEYEHQWENLKEELEKEMNYIKSSDLSELKEYYKNMEPFIGKWNEEIERNKLKKKGRLSISGKFIDDSVPKTTVWKESLGSLDSDLLDLFMNV
ncbi:hypothetical protein TSUD_409010 [Trifolium subterraneum]|uniref:ATP-dependent DNA helicase n=1 Tax=Trifolium subterraneum TaxID=3900 RepID=A0A2Z6PID6_TRISU|nr:hypothetical protein TSUD_409010 [Trifolium subterraneum]